MAIHLNLATGFEFPPFWKNEIVKVFPADSPRSGIENYTGNLYQDEVLLKFEGESSWWTMPLDPVVSVTGKNVIARRNVARAGNDGDRRGSIKEIWATDDYEINIAGIFIAKSGEVFPEAALRRLRRYCEAKQPVMIESRLLALFNISRIAIEDFSLPFTAGVENQMYTIKAFSDDAFDLLIEN
ncbi:MAG: DUF6046 domain-containing protein [Prevotellaceae bacterium]|jgi:hypothetical protein|nr:DUF6046 domain-containing protein [Prevotellaceae bacterium]